MVFSSVCSKERLEVVSAFRENQLVGCVCDEKREVHWLVLAEKEGCLDAHSKKDTLFTSELIRLFWPGISLECLCAFGIKNIVIVLLLLFFF